MATWEKLVLSSDIPESNSAGESFAFGTNAGSAFVGGNANKINIAIGSNAGTAMADSGGNVYIGKDTAKLRTAGDENVIIGTRAGGTDGDSLGHQNVLIGLEVAFDFNSSYSSKNVILGPFSGTNLGFSASNIMIGDGAGNTHTSGRDSVILGKLAGTGKSGVTTTESEACVYIGKNAKSDVYNPNNEIVIGADTVGNGTDTVTIGDSQITANYFNGRMIISKNESDEYDSNSYAKSILKLTNTNTSATQTHSLITFRLEKNGGDGYIGFKSGSSVNQEHFIVGNQVDGEILEIASGGNATFSGKVGIGTTPDNELHIADGSAGNVTANSNSQVTIESNSHASLQFLSPNNANSIIYFGDADDNDVGYINYVHSSNTMNFQTNTGVRLSIDGSGNTTFAGNVKLSSSTSSSPFLTIEDTNADDNMGGLKFIKDSASPNTGDKLMQIWAYGDNNAAEQILYSEIATLPTSVADGSEEGSMRFRVMNAGSFGETMRIRGNKVGIGTSSPTSALVVQTTNALDVTTAPTGSVSIGSPSATLQGAISGRQTSNTTALHLMGCGADGNTSGDMIFNVRENNNSTFGTLTNSAFKFQHFSTDLVTILRNGNVGIGTSSPSVPLHIYDGTSNGVALFESGDAKGGIALKDNSTSNNVFLLATGDSFGVQTGGVANRLVIDGSGNTTFANAVMINSSTANYADLTVGGTGDIVALRASSGTAGFTMYEAGTGRFNMTTLNGSNGIAFKVPSTTALTLNSSADATFTGSVTLDTTLNVIQSGNGANSIALKTGTSSVRGFFGTESSSGGNFISGSTAYATIMRSQADIFFSTGGNTQALKIDTNQNATFAGKVSIGTQSPASALQINVTDGQNIKGLHITQLDGGDWTSMMEAEAYGLLIRSTANDTTPALKIQGNGTSNEVLTALSNGKVGIGTDSPDHNLDIVSSGNAEFELTRTSGASIFMQSQSAKGLIGTSSNHNLSFLTNGGTRLTIDTSGDVTFTNTAIFANNKSINFLNTSGAEKAIVSFDNSNITKIGDSSSSGALKLDSGTAYFSGDVHIQDTGTPTLFVRNTVSSQNSMIHIGEINTNNYGLELKYEGNLGNTFIDNKYNHSTRPHIYFRMRTAGNNPLTALAINPDATTTFSYDATFNSGIVTLKGASGQPATLQLFADNGSNNSDHWRISSATDNILKFQTRDSGSYVNSLSIISSNHEAQFKGDITIYKSSNAFANITSTGGGARIKLTSQANETTTGLQFYEASNVRASINVNHSTDKMEFKTHNSGNIGTTLALTIDGDQNATFEGNIEGVYVESFSHNFTADINTDIVYIPWQGVSEGTTMGTASTGFLTPFPMELVSFHIRPETITNSDKINVQIYKQADGTTTRTDIGNANTASVTTNTVQVIQASTFDILPTVSANEKVGIAISADSDLGGDIDWYISTVWKVTKLI